MADNRALRLSLQRALKPYRRFPWAGLLALIVAFSLLQIGFYAVAFVMDLKSLGSHDYVVIQKTAGILNSVKGFSERELTSIESNSSVIRAYPVSRADGEVFASVDVGRTKFGTLLFVEAVSDDAVSGFSKNNNDYLEIIIGQSFLFLYNSTFAQAMGYPQVDSSVLSFIPLKIEFRGGGNSVVMPAKIIGTTDRIDSILISQKSLEKINKEIYGHIPESSKVLLNVVDKNAKDLKAMIKEGSYQTLDQNFSSSVITDLVQNGLLFVFVAGLILLIAAISVFVSQSHIIQYRSREAQLLLRRYGIDEVVIRSVLFYSLEGALRITIVAGIITNLVLLVVTSRYFGSLMGFCASLLATGLIYFGIRYRMQKKAA